MPSLGQDEKKGEEKEKRLRRYPYKAISGPWRGRYRLDQFAVAVSATSGVTRSDPKGSDPGSSQGNINVGASGHVNRRVGRPFATHCLSELSNCPLATSRPSISERVKPMAFRNAARDLPMDADPEEYCPGNQRGLGEV
ncbi:hypothetical protein BD309DRAFT_1062504 [Dichomitus squalens]|nr:hypothetical protein BD309DRAFT_1062504 [Dichomitus squalens]